MSQETDEQLKDWSDEDKAWLAKVPHQISHLAAKHGRKVTQWVIDSGNAAFALNQISRMTPGNRAATKAVLVLQKVLNDRMVELVTVHFAGGVKDFLTIKEEFDLALALQDTGQTRDGLRRSPGGIILDS